MLTHAYLPSNFMLSFIVPLIKDKKGDVTSKDNYRPIALTSIISKVFEIVILNIYSEFLKTAPNQFGYKFGLSTEVAIFSFKEIVNYYRSLSSNVYICLLDASKAFDRINHFHLFHKLLERNLPKIIVRILFIWYQTQCFAIKWQSRVSAYFNVSNGVRQGSILSPWLFNVFIDDLSINLNNSGIGCCMNNISFNHIQYADDTILLAPSPTGLQKLLNICEKFANCNDMLYNSKKTCCMGIGVKATKRIPDIFLYGQKLLWKENNCYLGVNINGNFNDDMDIKRQRKAIYSKGNSIIRKFKQCSENVKDRLFQAFCSNFYSCSLWSSFSMSTINSLKLHIIMFIDIYIMLNPQVLLATLYPKILILLKLFCVKQAIVFLIAVLILIIF